MLDADPEDAFCLYALGMEYAGRDEHQAAAAHLEQSLVSDPDQPYACFQLARSLAQLRKQPEAAAAIDRGLEIAESQGDDKAYSELAELRVTLRLDG
jgi:uncharacterized protein HemY